MRIFYADDDREEIGFFSEAVKAIDPNITCITAHDGDEALKLLQRIEAPDFIFLDLNMPKVDGLLCLKQIKADPELKNIPVIIYSSLVTEKQIHNLAKSGASKVLSKGCNIVQLANELRAILLQRFCHLDNL